MSNITEEAVEQINATLLLKKEEVIRKLLKKHKLQYILKDAAKRRFSRIAIEQHEDGSETVWIDDKSTEGLRLVTFMKCEPKMEGTELEIDLKYF